MWSQNIAGNTHDRPLLIIIHDKIETKHETTA